MSGIIKVLEIGSGLNPYQGREDEEVIHLDCRHLPHIEQIWNLENFPYPFPENYFDKIIALDVLEHLSNNMKVVEQLWRIAKPGALFIVRVPYWSSCLAHRDPTHQLFFDEHSFDYFGAGNYSFYSHAKLKVLNINEEEAYPRLFRFLNLFSPRLVRGIKKHFLNMIKSLTFEMKFEK